MSGVSPQAPQTPQATAPAPSSPPAHPSSPTASARHYAGLPDGVTVLHGVLYDTRPFVTFDPASSTPDYLYLPSPRASEMDGGAQ